MNNFSGLKKNNDFRAVYRKRRSKADKYFVMYILENGLKINRLGISVSKKVGNSVIRHRLARLIREVFRLHGDKFNSGLDIVVVARESANPRNNTEKEILKLKDVERSLIRLSGIHKIYDNCISK